MVKRAFEAQLRVFETQLRVLETRLSGFGWLWLPPTITLERMVEQVIYLRRGFRDSRGLLRYFRMLLVTFVAQIAMGDFGTGKFVRLIAKLVARFFPFRSHLSPLVSHHSSPGTSAHEFLDRGHTMTPVMPSADRTPSAFPFTPTSTPAIPFQPSLDKSRRDRRSRTRPMTPSSPSSFVLASGRYGRITDIASGKQAPDHDPQTPR